MEIQSKVIHGGAQSDRYGSMTEPVYRATTFGFDSVEDSAGRSAAIFAGEPGQFIYARLGNPTNAALERRMAALEQAEDCLVTASGIGAIATIMWSLLRQGDHVLADTALYGDTHALFAESLTRFGVAVDFVDFTDLDSVRRALRPNTAIVYCESPCNPTLKCNDIAAVSRIAHEHGGDLRVVVDNTFATPYLQNPLTLGADLVVHSMTKYLGGHSDVVAGCVCGSAEDISQLRLTGLEHATGAVLAPDNAYLVLRGIATLSVRMDRHCDNAEAVAHYLERSPRVARVHYPGLLSDPGHDVAARQMRRFGGIVSCELNLPFDQVKRFVGNLRLVRLAVSLGGVESLTEHPVSMTHSSFSAEELQAAGIARSLVRISVGIEDVHDIIEDLEQAFHAVEQPTSWPVVVAG